MIETSQTSLAYTVSGRIAIMSLNLLLVTLGQVLAFTALIASWSSENTSHCILALCGAHSSSMLRTSLTYSSWVRQQWYLLSHTWISDQHWFLGAWLAWRGQGLHPAALSVSEVKSTPPVEHGPLHRKAVRVSIHKTNGRDIRNPP